MITRWTRRTFVSLAPALGVLGLTASPAAAAAAQYATPNGSGGGAMPDWFPRQDPQLVQDVVGASHGNLARVRELVERQPALARANHDWGFGDWESALGAAAHTGRREIAELLLAHGARPNLFSAAMLGQLEVVKAFVAAAPGIQRTLGPHGITLMSHARAGGKDAEPVAAYLATLGDADRAIPSAPIEDADKQAVVGTYAYGAGANDRFEVSLNERGQLGLKPAASVNRFLIHTGGLVFFPSGVPTVKIAFARTGDRVTQFTIADPEVILTAKRQD